MSQHTFTASDIRHAEKGVIPIPLGSCTEEDGTALTIYSAGGATPGFSQQGDEEVVLTWDGNGTPGDVAAVVQMPNDLDPESAVTLHLLGTVSSTTDTPVFTVEAYFAAAGAALNADANCGGETGEFSANTTLEEKTLTIAATDIPSPPAMLTLVFHPKDGDLGTDEFYLAGMWLEYTKSPALSETDRYTCRILVPFTHRLVSAALFAQNIVTSSSNVRVTLRRTFTENSRGGATVGYKGLNRYLDNDDLDDWSSVQKYFEWDLTDADRAIMPANTVYFITITGASASDRVDEPTLKLVVDDEVP